jgi:tetratricopeptide (TPR) repeat protein
MNLTGKKPTFRTEKPQSNPYRMMIWLMMIVVGYWVIRSIWVTNTIAPAFEATATPTRTINSYSQEADAYFVAGNLDKAIEAYQNAARINPNDAELLAKLARIQVYKSKTMRTPTDRTDVLRQALQNAEQANKLAPDDSTVAAIHALALDWNGTDENAGDQGPAMLAQAQQEAKRAIDLDPGNMLAVAYYAEILVDQGNWTLAQSTIQQAVNRNPSIMDVYRVSGYVLENGGYYRDAIEQYIKAAAINPNLTFLYIEIGVLYRQLQVYDKALEYFQKAVDIDKQLNINDPTPYISIAKTYSQTGDFYAASRNVIKALQLNPASPDVYGQLAIVMVKSKNYEGALPAFQCALEGCTPQVSCSVRECNEATDPQVAIQGMDISASTEVYYYTYGSILAGLHRRGDDKCTHASQIFSKVKAEFSDDPIAVSIVQAGEKICAGDTSGSVPLNTITPVPSPMGYGTATPPVTVTPASQ